MGRLVEHVQKSARRDEATASPNTSAASPKSPEWPPTRAIRSGGGLSINSKPLLCGLSRYAQYKSDCLPRMPVPPCHRYLTPKRQLGHAQLSMGCLDQRQVLIPLLEALRHVVNDALTTNANSTVHSSSPPQVREGSAQCLVDYGSPTFSRPPGLGVLIRSATIWRLRERAARENECLVGCFVFQFRSP